MKKQKTLVRILCIALAALLVLGLIPIAAMAADGITLYFDNTEGWSTVCIYYWSDSNTGMVSWPGSNMTLVEGSIYSYTVPADATKVIFNNGSDSSKTGDLTIPSNSDLYTYSTSSWSAYKVCSHNYVDGVCSLCGAAEPVDQVVYFDNTNSGWSQPYVYTWTDSTNYTGAWPGTAMNPVTGVDNLYCYTVPAGAENIIFNNGSSGDGNQTADMTLPTDGKNLYIKSSGTWSSYNPCTHTWDEGTVTTAATCTTTGVMTYTCTNCGETKTESIEVADHTYENGVCTVCGLCNHSWDEGSVTTAPTCIVAGVKTYTCGQCGETKTEAIAAAGHSFTDGVCTVCGAPEECTDHVWDEGVVIKEKTCWTAGSKQVTCTVCGVTETQTIYAGHDFYYQVTKEPTCTAMGKQAKKCYNCAYVADSYLPKIDHAYVAGKVVAVTCTTDGYTVYTCSGCGGTANKDVVYHTGHNWSGNTCTVCGEVCDHTYVDGICSNCHKGGPAYVEGYYEIANAAQLYWFADQVNSGSNAINGKLIADIDLNNATWTAIGYYCEGGDANNTLAYAGLFDGQGHTVSNFTTAGTDNEGLFGYTSSATIMNLGVVGANVTGWNAGAVVGYASTSTIENCFAKDCTVTGYTTNPIALQSRQVHVGAVAGEGSGYVYNCYAVNCTLIDRTGDMTVPAGETYTPYHAYYAAPVGGNGSSISNNYYNNVSGTFSSTSGATEVTAAQLASGEITYKLNKGVVDGTQAWYQTCGVGMPAHSGMTVYEVTDAASSAVTYTNTLAECSHNYEAVVTAPTCTKDGYTTHTCSACGDSYTDSETAATGIHTYVDGTCTGCGAVEAVPAVKMSSVSLALKDEVKFTGYFTIENIDASTATMGLMTFENAPTDVSVDTADHVIPGATYQSSKDRYIGYSQGIPAKEMGDLFYICAYVQLENGTYVYSDVVEYSVEKYAYAMLDYTNDADLQKLLIAMLNYGAEAQLYFGYNTDDLVNADLTDEQKNSLNSYSSDLMDAIVTADSSKTGNFVYTEAAFSTKTVNVTAGGALALNCRFNPAYTMDGDMTLYYWDAETYNSVSELTTANATGSATMTVVNGAYQASVTGIAAKDIDKTIYAVGVYESDGITYTTGVISYNLNTYFDILPQVRPACQGVCEAAVVYCDYAKLYFLGA